MRWTSIKGIQIITRILTTKTAKQISDKWRLLPRKPAEDVYMEPGVSHPTRRASAGLRMEPGMSHQPRKPAVDKEPEISHLLRRPAAGVRTEPEIRHHPDKEKKHLGKVDHQREGKLQGHYQRTLPECLSAGTINGHSSRYLMDRRRHHRSMNQCRTAWMP